LSINIIS